ncbi:MAG: hypothetical protein WC966_00670 [Bradymonadales bacterium]
MRNNDLDTSTNSPQTDIIEEEIDESIDYNPTAFDRFCRLLDRLQWLTLLSFFAGVIAFFFHRPLAFYLMGASLLYSGLVPILSGSYRGPFGLLYGFKARLRGSFSFVLGIAVIALGFYAQNY